MLTDTSTLVFDMCGKWKLITEASWKIDTGLFFSHSSWLLIDWMVFALITPAQFTKISTLCSAKILIHAFTIDRWFPKSMWLAVCSGPEFFNSFYLLQLHWISAMTTNCHTFYDTMNDFLPIPYLPHQWQWQLLPVKSIRSRPWFDMFIISLNNEHSTFYGYHLLTF